MRKEEGEKEKEKVVWWWLMWVEEEEDVSCTASKANSAPFPTQAKLNEAHKTMGQIQLSQDSGS